MKYQLYLVTNTVNGKRYVGQTIQRLSVRWSGHVSKALVFGSTYPHGQTRKRDNACRKGEASTKGKENA